jgi:hypothetical protein
MELVVNLVDVASGPKSIPLSDLSADRQLATEVQNSLITYGILDPPADGKFGPVSNWAFAEYAAAKNYDLKQGLTPNFAKQLLGPGALPVKSGQDLAGRIATCMNHYNYWINRHPDCYNIVYVEGMNLDGTPNDNKPNQFNDCRCLLSIDHSGRPVMMGIWRATTEPSKYWTEHPMNPKGAARIAFGQYKAWSMGFYVNHEALLQVENITVFRDLNKDYVRTGDQPDTGLFGIHHHWGYDYPDNDLGQSSAGCLVGQKTAEHRKFISILKGDPRYEASKYYRFMATVVPYRDLP